MMDASVYKDKKTLSFFHLVTNYFFPRGLSKIMKCFLNEPEKNNNNQDYCLIRRNYLLLCIFLYNAQYKSCEYILK